MRPKTSPIYSLSSEKFKEILSESCTIQEALLKMGSSLGGGNHRTLYQRCLEENVDLEELNNRRKQLRRENGYYANKKETIPLEDILVEHSSYCRKNLKKRLLKLGLLTEKCECCGQGDVWNGQPLVLMLDHINGIRDDNRIENLRMICPNCHTQTQTYSGRQNKISKKCIDCGCPISKFGTRCLSCAGKMRLRKVENPPTKEELEKLLEEKSTEQIARDYGISGTAVRKWIAKYHLPKQRERSKIKST